MKRILVLVGLKISGINLYLLYFLKDSFDLYTFIYTYDFPHEAIVDSSSPTKISSQKRLIWKHTFHYTLNHKKYISESYSTHLYTKGSQVKIFYDKSNPDKSIIENSDPKPLNALLIVPILVFFSFGLILIYNGLN